MIRILLADDHPIVRDGLRAVLSTQADFAVVGEAESGTQALAQIAALEPDILLLDLEMPDGDGVVTLQALAGSGATVRVIIFTAFDTDDRIVEAVRAGAKGYLLKGAPRAELFNAIRVVHSGGSLLQPVIASKLIGRLTQTPALVEPLTAREQEVLTLIAQGLPNKEIAARLVITERTVKFHATDIMSKLGSTKRTEAVALARQQNLLT